MQKYTTIYIIILSTKWTFQSISLHGKNAIKDCIYQDVFINKKSQVIIIRN